MLGIGRSTIDKMVADGSLKARKLRFVTIIPHAEVVE